MRYSALLGCLLAVTVACGTSVDGPGAGATLDAAPAADSGATADASVAPDTADAADAASSTVDSGASVANDAGLVDASRGETARAIVAGGGRLVDVRSADEYASGHIDGAVNFPLESLPSRLTELEPKDKWVVVYCHSGNRSKQAATLLTNAGFSKVFDLGAIDNW